MRAPAKWQEMHHYEKIEAATQSFSKGETQQAYTYRLQVFGQENGFLGTYLTLVTNQVAKALPLINRIPFVFFFWDYDKQISYVNTTSNLTYYPANLHPSNFKFHTGGWHDSELDSDPLRLCG